MTEHTDTGLPADTQATAKLLLQGQTLCDKQLYLNLGEFSLSVASNSQPLLDRLEQYFSHLPQQKNKASVVIVAIESEVLESGLPFIDWKREPGKTGRKDAYMELPDGRLVLKVRTGMLFLQSQNWLIAAGPCLENDNQLINYINSQIMNRLQHQNWLISHAAGLMLGSNALAIVGFSGGGKSTLMLHLMEHPKSSFLTNDRLFLRAGESCVEAVGIPKLPRINPGTVVNNERLKGLINETRRSELLQMPKQALWDLEEKFDVDIDHFYGKDRINTSTPVPLTGLLILNWSREETSPVEIKEVALSERSELLKAVMKSPGPFYQDQQGRFLEDEDPLPTEPYQTLLKRVSVYEVTGQLDFEALTALCFERWGS
ncbi:MAG: HprK-related kinase B [Candidatus Thiodiazotropha sp. DIVDIV]